MINRVTITGADDKTDIVHLLELSAEFPFVEWAILVSRSNVGTPRRPSFAWQEELCAAKTRYIKVAMHLCGSAVRDLLVGKWRVDAPVADIADRIQINTHAQIHRSTLGLFDTLADRSAQWIFQLDAVNDHLLGAALYARLNAVGLFDTSHGAGISPAGWPSPLPGVYAGYAGGIGPDNILHEIGRINAVCLQDCWIDMERNVRTLDDSELDLIKVRRVLETADRFINSPAVVSV